MRTIDFEALAHLSDELDAEKPYVELIDGVEVPKASPRTRHSLLQMELASMLKGWAAGRGRVGPEWRFWLVPEGERKTSLVPDVAFVAGERLAALDDQAVEMPPFAPDVAVEIRSPGDRERNVQRKVVLYLTHGARLVIDVDPARRVIVAHATDTARTFRDGDVFEHEAAFGFSFEVGALFDAVERRR